MSWRPAATIPTMPSAPSTPREAWSKGNADAVKERQAGSLHARRRARLEAVAGQGAVGEGRQGVRGGRQREEIPQGRESEMNDDIPGPTSAFWSGVVNAIGIYLVIFGVIILVGHLM